MNCSLLAGWPDISGPPTACYAEVREGYEEAEGLPAHVDNVDPLREEALNIAAITRLEIHRPEEELAKLLGALPKYEPQFPTLEHGFRR